MERKRFFANQDFLPQMLEWVRDHLIKHGMDTKAIRRIELASEEALVNIMQYGYGEKKGEIELCLEFGEKQIKLTIRDWGSPFNPIENAPAVFVDASIDEREIGGLGIHLIRQVMDEVLYTREQDANLLTLVKYFSRTM